MFLVSPGMCRCFCCRPGKRAMDMGRYGCRAVAGPFAGGDAYMVSYSVGFGREVRRVFTNLRCAAPVVESGTPYPLLVLPEGCFSQEIVLF